jgi:hypothetical protein
MHVWHAHMGLVHDSLLVICMAAAGRVPCVAYAWTWRVSRHETRLTAEVSLESAGEDLEDAPSWPADAAPGRGRCRREIRRAAKIIRASPTPDPTAMPMMAPLASPSALDGAATVGAGVGAPAGEAVGKFGDPTANISEESE